MKRFLTSIFLFILFTNYTNAQMFWNQAATFDGNNYLSVDDNSFQLNMGESFTVEAWINPDITVANSDTISIFSKGLINSDIGFELALIGNSTHLLFRINNETHESGFPIQLGQWNHIAVTFDNTDSIKSIYQNGFPRFLAKSFESSMNNNQELLIGGGLQNLATNFSRDNFKGYMDEIRVWGRALSDDEISSNFRLTLSAKSDFSLFNSSYYLLELSLPFQKSNSLGEDFSLEDFSGNLNTVTAINGTFSALSMSNTPYSTIQYNTSLKVSNLNSVRAVDSPENSPTSGITLEAWIYPTKLGDAPIINKVSSYQLGLISSANLLVAFINGTPLTGFNDKKNIAINRWTHVAFTYSVTGKFSYYIDGNLADSGTSILPGGMIVDSDEDLLIGTNVNSSYYFNGYIDEVRIAEQVKSATDIYNNLYCSEDQSNTLMSNELVYNFDGYGTSQADGEENSNLKFLNNAQFASSEEPVSPLLRMDSKNFQESFNIKQSNINIPEIGIIEDTLDIAKDVTIHDINLFIALNAENDISNFNITLISPNGDLSNVYGGQKTLLDSCKGLITIFDDNADSSIADEKYVSFSPTIQPQLTGGLNTKFAGDNSKGKWILRIEHNVLSTGGGRLYAWGVQINNQILTEINNNSQNLDNLELKQNYPNPFNPITKISFNIPEKTFVKLTIYDIQGKEINFLINSEINAGNHEVEFDGSNLSSGIYFYKLETSNWSKTFKMSLIK